MVYSPEIGRMILFGGENDAAGQSYGDTWSYDVKTGTWRQLETNDLQRARDCQSMVYDPGTRALIMFGGEQNDGTLLFNDVWSCVPETSTWTVLVPSSSLPQA